MNPNTPFSTIAVIGAGTMGRGIAQVAALAGYRVVLYDLTAVFTTSAQSAIFASIDQGVARGKTAPDTAVQAKQNLILSNELTDTAVADLIIEAIPERRDLKDDLFRQLDQLAPATTIFASNTSSFSINALASATQRPDRFVGLHFFNPAHIMRLVEVIPTEETSAETLTAVQTFVQSVGKTAVLCQDTPAFIVNRVARPFYGEAFRLLGEGKADAATIDTLLESLGFRMGPFRLIDLIGCDVNFAVTQSVYEAYFHDPKYRPHPIQRRMVESGKLGRKTGRGFYLYKQDKNAQ